MAGGRRRVPPLAVGGVGVPVHLLLADESAGEVQSVEVRYCPQQQLCPVVVDDSASGIAVPEFDLRDVLEDRDDLHPHRRGGRGDRRQVVDGSDVGGLVEDDQQRRVERLPCSTCLPVGAADHLPEQRGEQWAEAVLLVGWRAQVERVATAVENFVGGDLAAPCRVGDGRVE